MPNYPIVKIFVAGEGGTGKTTLVERYVKGVFIPDTLMTIGVSHSVKDALSSKGNTYTLQVWDLGGEDRFRFIIPTYVKGAQLGLLVFDSTRFSTFKHLGEWLELIRSSVGSIPIVLVGTKTDIPDAMVKSASYDEFVKSHDLAGFFMTSSKDGTNVEKLFDYLVELYEKIREKNPQNIKSTKK